MRSFASVDEFCAAVGTHLGDSPWMTVDQERIDKGLGLPQYIKDHVVYYAGPAKTPAGYASGSFGPTTAGRMDSYVDGFMEQVRAQTSLSIGNSL